MILMWVAPIGEKVPNQRFWLLVPSGPLDPHKGESCARGHLSGY